MTRVGSVRACLLALGLYSLFWFGTLGRPLFEPDEGRYAEIPREMLVSGDWVTPRLDGFLYFEKPPLSYWATAAIYRVLGPTAFASRLWSATTGFLLLLLVWFAGGRLFGPRAGPLSGLVLGGTSLFVGLGIFNTLDMALTAFTGAALITFALAQSRRDDARICRRYMLLTWLAMALAVLTKGLVGIAIPGGTVVVYSLWARDRRVWRHLHILPGLGVFLLIAAPWFVLVSLRNPDFPRFFFLREHLERFLTDEARRGKPWYFFILVLPAGLLPFTVPVIRALGGAVRRRLAGGQFNAERLLAAWSLFVVVFFSLSESKLVGYVGPMLPALALLAGRRLARRPLPGLATSAWLTASMAAVLLLAVPYVPLLRSERLTAGNLEAFRPWLAGAGGALLVGALLAFRSLREERALGTLAALSLGWVAAVATAFMGVSGLLPDRSSRQLADFIRDRAGPETPIYMVDRYDQSLPFYLRRKVSLVRYRGELEFGVGKAPGRWIRDYREFARIWKGETNALAVVAPEEVPRLEGLGVPMEVIFRTRSRLILTRPHPR